MYKSSLIEMVVNELHNLEKPSRDLDVLIGKIFEYRKKWDENPNIEKIGIVYPFYTKNISDAIGLIPDNYSWTIEKRFSYQTQEPLYTVILWRDDDTPIETIENKSLAVAICIAALTVYS